MSGWEIAQYNYETQTLPDPAGRMVVITATREISWSIPSLANNSGLTLSFSGDVVGQADNTAFTNRVFALYHIAGQPDPGSASAEELGITAHMRIPIENVGGTSISGVPTWFSRDMGGTISQDWGDFDRDGDPDLALGSALGTTIYRNDDGQLTLYWLSPPNDQDTYRLSYDVRWADVNPNNTQLELVAVGDVVSGTATFVAELPGINYVYVFTNTVQKFIVMDTFTSTYQLVRVEPGDFDADGDVDLVASTNSINADCPVILYRNLGAGNFTNAPNSDDVHNTECLSASNAGGGGATAALGPADYDNDGDLDLALGVFPATLRLLINNAANSGPLTTTNPFTTSAHIDIETTLQYIPYDLAWGDYNADGYLDLAAAYPLQRTARVYNNKNGATLAPLTSTIRTDVFFTPRSLDWGDFNADGQLDIVVANDPPGIYQFNAQTYKFEKVATLALPNIDGQVWSLRGINLHDADSLNLIVSNRDGPSQLFNAFGPRLRGTLTPITNKSMSSVDWGDIDADRDRDLLYGSGPARLSSQLQINKAGDFATDRQFLSSGFGPHNVAYGDMTTDGTLDIAIGTLEKLQIYTNDQIDDSDADIDQSPTLTLLNGRKVHSLAWGDANDDGKLDILVGTEDAGGKPIVQLHLNKNNLLQTTPTFTLPVASKIQSLLWKDFDNDYYIDFAVGQSAGPTLIYRNNGNLTFSPYWNSGTALDTRSIDAADYDNDGDFDLVEGNYGDYDYVWENVTGTLTSVLTFTTAFSQTTSVAWGDWDLDGYPDIAAGKYNAYDIVYANKKSAPGEPLFTEAWRSKEIANTTGIAWGDRDNDGDLDLAVSRTGGAWSGFYENITSDPAHIATSDTGKNYQLPNEAPYVYIERPGPTDDAYRFSSPNVLAGPTQPTMDIHYRLFDPEETPLAKTLFEYSLDGGTLWHTATPAITPYTPTTRTSVIGTPAIFTWNAAADAAISDDARFRIRVIPMDTHGPVQKSANLGVSPPFRVRATTCTWPSDVVINAYLRPTGTLLLPAQMISPGQEIELKAQFSLVSGEVLTQSWDFGDGTPVRNLSWPTVEPITHVFNALNVYTVTARIHGEACPVARPGYAARTLYVGVYRPLDYHIYLPLILKTLTSSMRTESPLLPPVIFDRVFEPPLARPSPPPVIHAPAPQPQAVRAILPGNAIQVTDSPLGVDSQPAINSDGTKIAFWSTGRHGANNADGNIEIFLSTVDTDGKVDPYPLQLTDSKGTILGGFNLGPSINATGDRLVFFSDQNLLAENNTGATVWLSNTGTLLAQQNEDRNFELYMAAIENNSASLIQLTNTPDGENILPSISGDGYCIAFASNIDLTGTRQRQNGSGIFVATVTQTQNITWEVRYTQIVTVEGVNDQPSISKNGRFVAFVSDQDLVPGSESPPNDNREIFLAEMENHQVKRYIQVTKTTDGINEQPSIVSGIITAISDIVYITFLSDWDWADGVDNANRDRQVALAVITTTTSPPDIYIAAIPQDPGEKDYPTISADGGRIAYISTADQKLHLYDTFEKRDIAVNADIQHAFPALSADGTQMAFVANWDIYRSEYPLVDLWLTKSANTDKAIAGETITYTFHVTNTGPSPANDVTIVDVLPDGIYADLKPWDPSDYIDAGASGFSTCTGSGCKHHGTGWNAMAGALTIADFNGRVFDLPDRYDTPSADHWTNMTSNELLLHMESVPPPDVNTKSVPHTVSYSGSPAVVSGQIGNALAFNGDDALAYLNVLDTPWFGATSTWMAWVRMDSTSPGSVAAEMDNPYDGWVIDFPTKDQIRFRIANYWGYLNWTVITEKTANLVPEVGEWFHLAVTWRDSYWPSDVHIYVNGREVQGPGNIWISDTGFGPANNWMTIGRDHFGYYFRGALDEVAAFKRLLSPDELLPIYERQAPDYTAYFDSALMRETTGSNAWSTLAWWPSLPIGVELPDNGANWTISDTLALANSGYHYPTATLAMSETVLLMHMNEADQATSFFDTSGVRDLQGYRNEAYCTGNRCPQSESGRFNGALHFDGSNDYVYLIEPKDFPNTQATVMFWARTNATDGGLFQYSVTDSPSVSDGVWRFQANEFSIHNPNNLTVRIGGQTYASGLAINDGEWHHVAVTWDNIAKEIEVYKDGGAPQTLTASSIYTLTLPHNDGRFPARVVLGNRLDYNYSYAYECFYSYYYYCYSYLTGIVETAQHPYLGAMDELAVFKRALSSQEIQAAYLRGTGKMLFQVRTCTTTACSGADEYFVGPGGLRHTYFTDKPDYATPLWSLGDIAARPFLQYRTTMEGYDPNDTPELITVTVKPRAECTTNGARSVVTCTLSTRESPLPPDHPVIANIPVTVTGLAYLSATYDNGQYSIANDARISALEADHNQDQNTASVTLLLDPIIVTSVDLEPANLSGDMDQTYVFTASVQPNNATPPVIYEWSATGYGTEVFTVTTDWLSHTMPYSWTIAGVKTVTVSARNSISATWQTASVDVKINHPQPVITNIVPADVNAYSSNVAITINGSGFVDNNVTRVLWNGALLANSGVLNSTTITAVIPAANVVLGGYFNVNVRNAETGLDTRLSNTEVFTVYNRVPIANSVNPVSTLINTSTPIIISGDYFATTGTIVRLYSPGTTTVDLTPSAATRTQINATIPNTNIQIAGYYSLTVQNPVPHRSAGESPQLLFTVNNPQPTITSFSPTSTITNTGFTLNITGTNFVNGALISWDGTLLANTVRISSTRLEVTLTNNQVPNTAGNVPIFVRNPAPSLGDSNTVQFPVQ